MKRTLLGLLSLLPLALLSQVSPLPGAKLTYSEVLIQHPPTPRASYYQLHLSTATAPTVVLTDSSEYTLVKQLTFGNRYQWHYIAFDEKGKQIFRSESYDFALQQGQDSIVGGHIGYLERGQGSLAYYVLEDGTRRVFNPAGQSVWFFPPALVQELGQTQDKFGIRDLRMTPEGTFTCIVTNKADGAIEFDRNGRLLWQAPLRGGAFGDESENYHHDFRKLPNGNYMVLSESKQKTLIPSSDLKMLTGNNNVVIEGDKAYNISTFGTVVEYDPKGKVVWAWNSADFFNGLIAKGEEVAGTHLNAFYQSKDGRFVYLGFRDVSLVVKVDKQQKSVVATYGTQSFKTLRPLATNSFAFQHSIEQLENGNLLIYNNDSVNDVPALASSLVEINEKGDLLGTFSCKTDDGDDGKSAKYGSAEELPNQHILLGVGALGKICELKPTGKGYELCREIRIQNHLGGTWQPAMFYRSHYALSLYPYLFSTTIRKSHIRIANEGELADNYTYVFLDEKSKPVGSPLKLYVEAGGYAYIPITANKHKKIEIRSENVPYKAQIIDLP